MTFDDFRNNIRVLLEDSSVNLGRKTAKTRSDLISSVMDQIDEFGSMLIEATGCRLFDSRFKPQGIDNIEKEIEKDKNPEDSRLVCLKPKDPTAALNVGKGCHAMTPTQSRVADEELNRSPYGKGKGNG